VQSGVEGGLAGALPVDVGKPRADVLEREGIVARQRRRHLGEEGGGGLDRVTEVVHRRGLAAPHQPLVLELDLHHRLGGPRAARYAEGLGQGEAGCAGPELHEVQEFDG
jgi:hypothetical protein